MWYHDRDQHLHRTWRTDDLLASGRKQKELSWIWTKLVPFLTLATGVLALVATWLVFRNTEKIYAPNPQLEAYWNSTSKLNSGCNKAEAAVIYNSGRYPTTLDDVINSQGKSIEFAAWDESGRIVKNAPLVLQPSAYTVLVVEVDSTPGSDPNPSGKATFHNCLDNFNVSISGHEESQIARSGHIPDRMSSFMSDLLAACRSDVKTCPDSFNGIAHK